MPSADGFPNLRSAGSLAKEENTRDSLLNQESVKVMECGTLSPLSKILSSVGYWQVLSTVSVWEKGSKKRGQRRLRKQITKRGRWSPAAGKGWVGGDYGGGGDYLSVGMRCSFRGAKAIFWYRYTTPPTQDVTTLKSRKKQEVTRPG